MLMVYFDSHAGFIESFQTPCRLAAYPGERELEISR
jgi:hypothetical protein